MGKLFDKLMNRVIKGKLTIEKGDDVSAVEPSLKASAVEYDSSKDYTQAELREIASHQIIKFNDLFYVKSVEDSYQILFARVDVNDDGVANGTISSLIFGLDDENIYPPDEYSYSISSVFDDLGREQRLGLIPQLSELTVNFGNISSEYVVNITGKYTLTKFQGTISQGGSIKINLPKDCVMIQLGGEQFSEFAELDNYAVADYDGNYVLKGSPEDSGWVLEVVVTDYVAYLTFIDNN